MSRRSDEHPAMYPTEHSGPRQAQRQAQRQEEYPAWEYARGRDERRVERTGPAWAEYPAREPARGRDERSIPRRDERLAPRRAERRAERPWAQYPARDPARGGDEHSTQRYPAFDQGEYPTQDYVWEQDEPSAWEQDEPPAARPVARRAGYGRPAEPEASRHAAPARHRKPSFVRSAVRRRFVWIVVAVVAAAAAGLVVGRQMHWSDVASQPAAVNRATAPSGPGSDDDRLGVTRDPAPAVSGGPHRASRTNASGDRRTARRRVTRHSARRSRRRSRHGLLAAYGNPVRAISGLLPERIDMGVDFGGSGPIYAIGSGVVISAMTGDGGWPGGGWMSYRITAGPANGLVVFVAEDITPTVTTGQTVNSKTVIANMFKGSAGIETGWAQSNGMSPESQAPEAGAIWGQGPFPTAIGMNFEELLQALGVPAGYGRDQSTSGTLPAGYRTSW